MTAYVSAANGNHNVAATWTPAAVPGVGDTVTINHVVTVPAGVTWLLGASPGSCVQGSASAAVTQVVPGITVNSYHGYANWLQSAILTNNPTFANAGGASGGQLVVAAGATVQIRGDIVLNGGPMTLAAGAQLVFDTSAAPAGTVYRCEVANPYNISTGVLTCNGTAGSRCRISGTSANNWCISGGWRTVGVEGYTPYADWGAAMFYYTDTIQGGIPASTLQMCQTCATNTSASGLNVTGGVPTIVLSNGATATYQYNSAASLFWQTTQARTYTNTRQLRMGPAGITWNGATVKDSNGSTRSILSGYSVTQSGSTLTLTTTWSAPATAVGVPVCLMTDGSLLSYASGSGTSTLVFSGPASQSFVSTASCFVDTFINIAAGTITDASGGAVPQYGEGGGCWFAVQTSWINGSTTVTDGLPWWSFRPATSAAAASARSLTFGNSTAQGCTSVHVGDGVHTPSGINFYGSDFIGGVDNLAIVNGSQGSGITEGGGDIVLLTGGRIGTGPNELRLFSGCNFARRVVLQNADDFTFSECVFGDDLYMGVAGSKNLTVQHCLHVVPSGYVAGGQNYFVSFGSKYDSNIFCFDSPTLRNSHGLFCGFQSGALTGVSGTPQYAYITNNIVEAQRANASEGGNWMACTPITGGSTSASVPYNTCVVTGNIVVPQYNSIAGAAGPMSGYYQANGVLTMDAAPGQLNWKTLVQGNTFLTQATGNGCIAANEGGGTSGQFAGILDNIFWSPASTAVPHGPSYWDRHDNTVAVDECPAAAFDYNVHYNGQTTGYCNTGGTITSGGNSNAFTGGTNYPTGPYTGALYSTSLMPGVHDARFTGATPFLDQDRSTCKFDAVNGGPGTVASLVGQLFLRNANGIGGLYGLPASYNAAYTVDGVFGWIKAGFSPQVTAANQALQNGSSTGGYVGAVAPTLPPAAVITSVAASPSTGDQGVGSTVTLTVAFTRALTFSGGTPTLSLNSGGTATYVGGNGGTAYTFTTTVAAGQSAASLQATAYNANGGTTVDQFGTAASLGSVPAIAASPQIDGVAPTLAALAFSPSTGTLKAGASVAITLTASEPVTVTGSPTLSTNLGPAAFNAGASTATSLVFALTVPAGQTASPVAVSAFNLGGGTVLDGAGNALVQTLPAPGAAPNADGVAPVVSSVVFAPTSGFLGVGATYAISLAVSKSVTVTGSPALTMSDGSTAPLNAGASTPTSLVFGGTVHAGATASPLGVSSLNLNGGTIKDGPGNALNAAGATSAPTGGAPSADGVVPVVSYVHASPPSGDEGAGQTITFTVATSKAVTVVGAPSLTLNDGRSAAFVAGSSTPTSLAFTYTVQPGDVASQLSVTAFAMNGATILDEASNALVATGAVGVPTGGSPQVDGVIPVVSSVAFSPVSGTVPAGGTITITLALSKAITVTGAPSLTLSGGASAAYVPASSTPTSLAFTYTVQPGYAAAPVSVSGLSLSGATARDAAGNSLNASGATSAPTGGAPSADGVAPVVSSVSVSPQGADLGVGAAATFTLALSKAVTVSGAPSLTLTDGGSASYVGASSTPTALAFRYAVRAGDVAQALGVSALSLNGGTVTDAAGNALVSSGAAGTPAGAPQVDGVAPTVSGLSAAAGTYGAGATVAITVALSKACSVSGGAPVLTTPFGAATYSGAASGSQALVFDLVVPAGATGALTVGPLTGTIADAAGNPLVASGATGIVSGITLDGVAPVVASVTAAAGSYFSGEQVLIAVATSKAVTVSGTPSLATSIGTATYLPGSSSATVLEFSLTIASNAALGPISTTGLTDAGGSIVDEAGNALVATGAACALPGVVVVPNSPTVTGATATAGTYPAGSVLSIVLGFSMAVAFAGPSPILDLNIGAAHLASTTATTATFSVVVPAGAQAAVVVTDLNLNGGTITSVASGAALSGPCTFSLAGVFAAGAPPAVTGVSAPAGEYGAGATILVRVATSAATRLVDAAQPPVLWTALGPAYYVAASSTPVSLAFDLVVPPGASSSSLVTTALSVGGGITDAAGNNLVVTGAAATVAGVIVDAVAPTITSVTCAPGDYGIGSAPAIVLGLSKPVIVSGPIQLLTSVGSATYVPAGSSATSLRFAASVAAGTLPGTLAVLAFQANGGSVVDAAGNGLVQGGAAALLQGCVADGTTATVVGITSNLSVVAVGSTVELRIQTSKPLAVPSLGGISAALSNGATVALSYVSGSLLGFLYVPAGTDVAAPVTLVSLSVPGPLLDGFGNPADLTGAAGTIGQGLSVVSGLQPIPSASSQLDPYCQPIVPAEFVGLPAATLTQWLADCQNALQQLETGAITVSVSYQGTGGTSATFTAADSDRLRQRIRALSSALGLTPRRRPMRPGF